MSRRKPLYTVRFNPGNQEVEIVGSVRPMDASGFAAIGQRIRRAAKSLTGDFYLNLRRLKHLNHTGFVELARCLIELERARDDLDIKLIISSVVPWAEARFEFLVDMAPGLTVEVHNKDFYPGPKIVAPDGLIPRLRAQTGALWKHERKLLGRHGLAADAKVRIADVCCSIGDFATLVHKAYRPSTIVAVDNAQPFLEYAREVAEAFSLKEIHYARGDVSNLLLKADSFDFVICRLAIHMLDRTRDILQELFRITRPGGRVYLLTEFMSYIYGYPRDATVGWTKRRASEIFALLGSEVDLGPKTRALLADNGFVDIKLDLLELSSANADVDDFDRLIASWQEFVAGELTGWGDDDADTVTRMRQGFHDHIHAMTHRRGFPCWPVCVASGQKPSLPPADADGDSG